MLPVETLITFLSASVLLGLAPGPDNIFVLTQAALRGRGAGIIVMLGLCAGLVVHSIAVAFGVAAIFQTSELAFSMLKFIGAGYLLYLAWKAFTASAQRLESNHNGEVSKGRLFIRGVVMNITNPKVSIFFLAFLPQFTDPARGPISLQILMLGGLFILTTIVVFGGIALLAATLGQFFQKSDRAQTVLHKIAGTVFVGLAIKLATARQ